LIVDGGSNDNTLDICKKYPVKILKNKWKVEEKGKVVGIKAAKGEIIGFIDADNIIYDPQFFNKMLVPFKDQKIAGVDTLYYVSKKKDNLITRYCALLSGDDPYSIYLGLNDRFCFFKGTWTGMKHNSIDKGDYLKVKVFSGEVPTMGSNGFFVRKNLFKQISYDPFIHTDFVNDLVEIGQDTFGKAKTGLKHDMADFSDFFKKKIRRVKRRMRGEIKLKYNYDVSMLKLLGVSILFATFIVPIFDAIRGFLRKRDIAWIIHPFACFGVFLIYVSYTLFYKIIGRWFN
jgi:glycosyltransferase involved in cell wall biosynthesis